MKSNNKTLPGFTLIELLIVVLIIAILAAIAVPNFLEFQVRAKVSRVKADQRTLATGMEAYMVDNNEYPIDQENDIFNQTANGYYYLTTPISYLSSIPLSPFNVSSDPSSNEFNPWGEMASGTDNNPKRNCYMIFNPGPDNLEEVTNNDTWPMNSDQLVYDPTNGTVSNGEIFRFGGSYRQGNYTMHGISWETFGVRDVMP